MLQGAVERQRPVTGEQCRTGTIARMVGSAPRRPFEFIGNHIVLDFINTVNARPSFTRDDLTRAEDVVEWARAAGLGGFKRAARSAPIADGFDSAVDLRELLYRVFGPLARGDEPASDALAAVTRRAADAICRAEWHRRESGYVPTWPRDSIETLCDRLADSSVQLLRSPDVARIGACDGCGWLFLDTSRAHARRWCSMSVCGVRHKMRRYHQRQVVPAGSS